MLEDLPEMGLQTGQVGTVVHVMEEYADAYLVEFINSQGKPQAMPILSHRQLLPPRMVGTPPHTEAT